MAREGAIIRGRRLIEGRLLFEEIRYSTKVGGGLCPPQKKVAGLKPPQHPCFRRLCISSGLHVLVFQCIFQSKSKVLFDEIFVEYELAFSILFFNKT